MNAPQFSTSQYRVTIPEGTIIGSMVVDVTATDADGVSFFVFLYTYLYALCMYVEQCPLTKISFFISGKQVSTTPILKGKPEINFKTWTLVLPAWWNMCTGMSLYNICIYQRLQLMTTSIFAGSSYIFTNLRQQMFTVLLCCLGQWWLLPQTVIVRLIWPSVYCKSIFASVYIFVLFKSCIAAFSGLWNFIFVNICKPLLIVGHKIV